jgi:phthiodiolone/phenolphthiodiolone dimycocerosates ketoreductase
MTTTTAVPLNTSLHIAPQQFAELARAVHGSGVVDNLFMWDQLTNFWPPHLWTVENTPLAAVVPDLDSYCDAFAMGAYALAVAPGAGVAISTDAIRRGPAELNQTMWTLTSMAGGRAVFQIGAGEAKQTGPFGWRRSEGLARLEDQLRLVHEFWERDEPVDFEGNHWTMRRAWLGRARVARPQVWALGGGPRLLDLATTYADGFAAIAPCVADTPERFAQTVRSLREDLERKGRDPETFGYGLWFMNALHEDRAILDRAFDGPIMKWMAATFGRLDQADWRRAGLEPVYPEGWHYSIRLRPMDVTQAQAADVVARTTRDHCRAAFSHGTPAEVAAEVQAYVDAGCTYVAICDLLPLCLEPDDAQTAIGRSLQVCARIKAAQAVPGPAIRESGPGSPAAAERVR